MFTHSVAYMNSLLTTAVCSLPNTHTQIRRWLLVTIVLSVVGKLALSFLLMIVHSESVFESSDSLEYHQLASNLLQHGTFSRGTEPPYEPELLRTPGYPLLLAGIYGIFGIRPAMVICVQLALTVATILAAFQIAARLFDERVALLAAMLLAVDPVSIYYSQVLLTETFFTTVFTVSLLLLLRTLTQPTRWLWPVGAGIGFALATYIRPTTYYLGGLLPIIVFFMICPTHGWQRAAKPVLVFFLLYAVLIGGWHVHTYRETGSMEFSQIKNQYLFIAKAAAIVANRDSVPLDEAQRRLSNEHFSSLPIDLRGASPVQMFESQGKYAIRVILDHPILFLWTSFRGVFASLLGPSNMAHLFGFNNVALRDAFIKGALSGFSVSAWAITISSWIYAIIFLLILYSGVILFATQVRPLDRGTVLLIFTILYILVSSSGPEAYSRFRAPIMPALCVLSAAGFFHSLRMIRPSNLTAWPGIQLSPATLNKSTEST